MVLQMLSFGSRAQTFVNGDMNGTVDFTSIPFGWEAIPFTDPACTATAAIQATVDIADATSPSMTDGIAGVPYSGTTFCTGLHAGFSGGNPLIWHEGIQQEVTGFTPGEVYQIGFYQCVVQQKNCIDPKGSWKVYVDNVLLTTTLPSTSTIAYNSTLLEWEFRKVPFVATATTHTIKFIPYDDDANIETSEIDATGALRMGIDSIHFVDPLPPEVDLGPDFTICEGDTVTLNAYYPGSNYLWQDGSTDSVYYATQAGIYWVEVSNAWGTATDTIGISILGAPYVNLGPDRTLCAGIGTKLYPSDVGQYLWQDGSTDFSYTASASGVYTLQITNACGSGIDSMEVIFEDCSPRLKMPNVFTPNGDQTNDLFFPWEAIGIKEYELIVFNRWGERMFTASDPGSGWDGTVNGTKCPEGTYFWKVIYDDISGKEAVELHGFVQLVR